MSMEQWWNYPDRGTKVL